MKHALISSFVLLALGASANALAVPPAKSSILHCGCTEDGTSMVYEEISISSRSKGHDAHVSLSPDSCFDGVDTYIDFARTGSDCQVSGPQLGDPIAACDTQLEDDLCGAEITD